MSQNTSFHNGHDDNSTPTPEPDDHRGQALFGLAYLTLIATFSLAIITSFLLLAWLAWRQLVNPILYWDSFNLTDPENKGVIHYLLSPNSEHRIVFAKLNALIDYYIFGLPPASTAMVQQFLVILLCSGLVALISKCYFTRRKIQILNWLSCTLLLLIPWQFENFVWEFQGPWLLTNAFLLTTILAIAVWPGTNSSRRKLILAFISIQPWLAIFNSGQGFALIAATLSCLLLASRSLVKLYIISSAAAVLTYGLLPKPLNKPANYGFDIDFASHLLQGGAWPGLAPLIILLVTIAGIAITRKDPRNASWLNNKFFAALIPGFFSIFFALMVTISRVNVEWGSPNDSRYSTHMLMMGISALLITNLIAEKDKYLFLLPSFAVLLTTMLSFPQHLAGDQMMYGKAWKYIVKERKLREERFTCNLDQAFFTQSKLRAGLACEAIFPKQMGDAPFAYFSGQFGILPIGQHSRPLTQGRNMLKYNPDATYSFQIDRETSTPESIHMKGWAYDPIHPYERLFLIANYRSGKSKFYAIQERRIDVMRNHASRRESTGFSVDFPFQDEQSGELLTIGLAGRSGQKTIWPKDKL
jgi:hypothetical protein